MHSFSNAISDRPTAVVVIVTLLTAALGGVYLIAGGEMEATEETFMPSTDVVNASMEIGRDFESSEVVQVLVKAKNGNVLLPESLVEMLRVERAISEDEGISEILLSEDDPMRISGISDTLISAVGLLNTINGMVGTVGPQFLEVNRSMGLLLQAVQYSRIGIESSLGSPNLGNAIIAANNTLFEMAMALDAGQTGGSGSQPQSGAPKGGNGPMNYNEKIEFMGNQSRDDIRGLLSDVMNYNASVTKEMVAAVQCAVSTVASTVDELGKLSEALVLASSDSSVAEDPRANASLQMMQLILPLMSRGVSQTQEMAEELNIRATAKQLNSGMEGMKRGIKFVLTMDFSPETDIYKAEGTLIIVGFNATLAGEGEDSGDLLFRAEQSMEQIIEQQDLIFIEGCVTAPDLTSREILTATRSSMKFLLPVAFFLVIVVLGVVYRNVADMVISIMALGFAIAWTYGLGALAGFVLNPMTMAVPIVIMGLGIDYGIHLTLRYREERAGGASPKESSRMSITWVGSALLIATITTLVAFMANLISDMSALREFGILCSIGVTSALVIMVTFVPSCRQLLDGRSKSVYANGGNAKKKRRFSGATAALVTGATAAEHHPRVVILFTLMVTAGALIAATQLETRFELEDFLPSNLEYSQNLRYILNRFNISIASASILVKGNLSSPDALKAIDVTTLNMVDDEFVAMKATPEGDRPDVTSILSLMQDVSTDERIADPLDLYDEEFSQIFASSLVDPGNVPDKDINELLEWVYENDLTKSRARAVLHRDSDGRFDSTVIRIGTKSGRREEADRLLEELQQDATPLTTMVGNNQLGRATVTGSSIMLRQIIDSMQGSMTRSFILTLALSFIILTVVFWVTERSIVLGAITMIPVILCSSWILGAMYIMGIPYTMLTVMVTALTIGLGVTYGIHLTHRFVEELKGSNDIDKSCMETVIHTGSALFGAAATTVAGFGLLVFSLLPPVKEFGGTVALMIIFSFLATVFVLPTFLVIWAKRKRVMV